SGSALRIPAEPMRRTWPNKCSAREAAIGERTILWPHRKSTARGAPPGAFIASALPMQRTDQGEEPPRGIEVDMNLVLEPFDQKPRSFVVQAAAAHVDGFDAGRGFGPDRGVIAFANLEIVL